MKPVAALIGIAVAGTLGYFLEPLVRPSLVSVQGPETQEEPSEEAPSDEPAETAKDTPVDQPSDQPPPEPQPTEDEAPPAPAWVASLSPDQFPEKVTLKRSVEFSAPGAAQAMVMAAGTQVTPVRVDGNILVVSLVPGGPIEGRVPVMETDLVELLGDQPPTPEPPTPAPTAPEPDPVVAEDSESMEDPAPDSSEDGLDAEGIVKLMQESIKGGRISEFSFEQVLGWKAGEDEERDGVTYQTGTVAYKAETIFGVKTIQAQALIEDGKIVRWIWPKSGMEIN